MGSETSSVTDTNAVNEAMREHIMLAQTLLAGTSAMRKAGKLYLPQEPAEEDPFYANRLARSTLFNAFKKTQGVLAGKVFDKGIRYKDTPTSPFSDWLEDIDLEGNDVSQFSYEFFKRGLANGVDYILVDLPRPIARTDNQPLSVADESKQNIRPYWVEVSASNLLGWRSENINGVQTLTQIRIREAVSEQDTTDEFAEIVVTQIRVIDIGRVRIYRKNEKTKDWFVFAEWNTTFKFIPLVPFYAGKVGFLWGRSPLLDLAHLNVSHWQKSSDLSNILHLIQVPVLVASGLSHDEADAPLKVGPNTLVKFGDTSATLKYVEPTGNGTELGMKSLEQIEDQMAVMGASMLVDKPGNQTATQKAINEGGSNSDLAAIAKNFEDAINTAFAYMLRIMGLDENTAPEAQFNTDYGVAGMGAISIDQLLKMRVTGEISHPTFINRLNELTGFDINAEDEAALLEDEGPELEEVELED